MALAGSLVLIGMQWRDVAYFFSFPEPITLGSEGDYHFERLAENRYAQIHGAPSLRGVYSSERGGTYVVVALRGTPVLVRRGTLPGESWSPGQVPPQPNQRAFAVRGRLLRRMDAGRYREAFEKLSALGEVHPLNGALWMLIESEKPRSDLGLVATALLLAAFAALNAFFLRRSLGRGAS